jgi:4-amino-4-deoxy-L-arabinose transferase-like glycosyltransferase
MRIQQETGPGVALQDDLRTRPGSMPGHTAAFVLWLLLAFAAALALRGAFQPADPPAHAPVGITWHDEGVWAHNARNRVLFGAWRTDGWNPVFVSPVFTALEWTSFTMFGVGLSQARLPSILLSALSILALALGIRAVGTRLAAVVAAWLAASNYVYVMYGRVALLEATMISLMVMAWCCYALSRRHPALGLAAGGFAVVAFFTKASSAFFIVAIGLDCCWTIYREIVTKSGDRSGAADADDRRRAKAAVYTLVGMIAATLLALAVFVIPHWTDYVFYNIRLYGQRRTVTGLSVVIDRASWFPIIHDFFTRMLVLAWVTLAGVIAGLFDWKRREAGERLLWLWLVLGAVELIFHDTGNERRFVFLIPAMVGTAALVIGRDFRLLPESLRALSIKRAWWAMPFLAYAFYIGWGALARLPFLYQPRPGVRLAAALAIISVVAVTVGWKRGLARFVTRAWTPSAAVALVAIIVTGDLAQYVQWCTVRTYKNVEASRAVGRLLPWGTPVLGKLANGLALDNGIRPLYIGQGFGNYSDTALRATVPWVLTYTSPWLGYEGAAIREVLQESPGWLVVERFPVSETAGGHDMCALVLKPTRPAVPRKP